MTTIEDANFVLQKVLDAGSQKNVIELAWIKNVRVTIPRVIVTLSLPSFANSQRDRIIQEVRKVLLDFEDIDDVQIEIDIILPKQNLKIKVMQLSCSISMVFDTLSLLAVVKVELEKVRLQ